MYNDLMFFELTFVLLIKLQLAVGQPNTIYVERGKTVELCDNRSTIIFAYEYRSFDGKLSSIVEPSQNDRYSNPFLTSLLRIKDVNENDSGMYKCPQDDNEWQKLQVFVPIKNVYLSNLPSSSSSSSRILDNDQCGIDNQDCLSMKEGEPLDVVCAADGFPRPAIDVSLDKNGPAGTIMALAAGIQPPTSINNQFKPTVYEAYRLVGLTASDNGRNLTCQVDLKQIDNNLIISTTKKLYIEFRPTVIEKARKIYLGINHTKTINCTVQRANPEYLRFTVTGLPSSVIRRTYGDEHGLVYTFEIMPTSIDNFRPFNVTANNSVGFDTCTYELIHGGVPDAISHCIVDDQTSNQTTTITCTKSYAQGDDDGYSCTLFKYVDKNNRKFFEEIARTKSCIFALTSSKDPVEFRVAALNRYGSLPINQHGYVILLNQPSGPKETPFFNQRLFLTLASILGGAVIFLCICCLCGTCHRDRSKLYTRTQLYQKDRYPNPSMENDALKSNTDDNITPTSSTSGEKRPHQNGAVYDIPTHLNGKYSQHLSSASSAYHQQKPQQSTNLHYADQDSLTSSLNSIPIRARTFNNKFYGNPVTDDKYGQFSSPRMNDPRRKLKPETHEINEHDEEDDDESPVYSTTTDVMSESGSFLVPSSSSKRRAPPPPKPRYSTLSSIRLPMESHDKTPLPKPRSRSNSRTRLNNGSSDNSSYLYEERPVSSSDSGIGQSEVVCLPNGDTIRSGLVKSRQNSLQKQHGNTLFFQNQPKYETLKSPIVRGTEC